MVLKTFQLDQIPTIKAKPLTPDAFEKYGGVISADHQLKSNSKSNANYGTAIKLHKVSPILNNYSESKSGVKETANWNIFRCTAPNRLITHTNSKSTYKSTVLERHPFTTQTFLPLGQDKGKLSYLVIVANSNIDDTLPNLNQIEAFICKGNQSITYSPGVWHAPMVVIDESIGYLDFAVLIHENGVAEEDCQECYIKPGLNIEYTLSNSKL
ncbi:unnamed protein product [Candida verbasci]|uniref:Ureidoglycolate lyase n=1 Tax=Candida verbasci TaxID=1227364 RepID=A0A9W4XBI2_9ASCO|nr:unnamed protein product [Candida verbasci]